LVNDEGRLFVEVDGRRVELQEDRLSTSGHQVVLAGMLHGEADFKIEFDGRRESVRFGRGYPVEGMKMERDELVVRYAQSMSEKHEHRMYLEHLESPERPSLSQFEKPELLEHVKAFDHPPRVMGAYQFEIDRSVQGEIRALLRGTMERGKNENDLMKAEISERVAPNLLEISGWERIKRHPFNETKKDGASANGADWLMRTPDGKLALMEVKWYGNWEDGVRKAKSQIVDEFREHKQYRGQEIEAAYIAIMEWSVNDQPVRIYVKQIRPVEELA